MREHHVSCRLEGDISQIQSLVCLSTERFFAEMLERILVREGWSKEAQQKLIGRMLDRIRGAPGKKE